jgi:hypothetical protein
MLRDINADSKKKKRKKKDWITVERFVATKNFGVCRVAASTEERRGIM